MMRVLTARRLLLVMALVVPALAFAGGLALRPHSAEAHPLGNFTINRYSRLELYSDVVRVRYVLDMAEIPTFQEKSSVDADGDGNESAAELAAYAAKKADETASNLHLSVNGEAVPLRALTHDLSFPEGQAGLQTTRLALWLEAPVPARHLSIAFADDNYASRVGWKEMLVRPSGGVELPGDVPTEDRSDELTNYPADLLASPLDVRQIDLSFDPGAAAPAPAVAAIPGAEQVPERAPVRAGSAFASLVHAQDITLPVLLLSLLAALGFGALHALEPGHGKTFVAAYFVGTKGTVRQAASLGMIIAVTHTIGVMAIGLVTLFGSRWILPERLYPWLSLASGVMVVALGLRLIVSRGGLRMLTQLAWRKDGEHTHGQHGHWHDHGHAPPSQDAPPWRSLLALGLADGLTPSPSALIVLLAAISLDRIGLGLLLITAFSVGLAAVLTAVCLGLIFVRRILDRLSTAPAAVARSMVGRTFQRISESALPRLVPLGGAGALIVAGLILTARALSQPGLAVL